MSETLNQIKFLYNVHKVPEASRRFSEAWDAIIYSVVRGISKYLKKSTGLNPITLTLMLAGIIQIHIHTSSTDVLRSD